MFLFLTLELLVDVFYGVFGQAPKVLIVLILLSVFVALYLLHVFILTDFLALVMPFKASDGLEVDLVYKYVA